jgi:N-hydroxyarylamine O-acetyltransferase
MPASQAPLPPRDVRRYLERVGLPGTHPPVLETLVALHRAHLLAIPYENLDIHLGRRLSLDPDATFRKLVVERRGGWCYEMNGLFGRVLESLGFDVRYVSGAVGRAVRGDAVEGNHLVLLVTLARAWIVDVGFGDGFLEPLPLEPGEYRQGFLAYRVACHGERWVVHNHEFGGADAFDFTLAPRALGDFERQCDELQTSPESGFVKASVCQRFVPGGLVTLRGVVLRHVTATGVASRVVQGALEYDLALREHFGLEVPGVNALFARVWSRHQEWMAAQGAVADAG